MHEYSGGLAMADRGWTDGFAECQFERGDHESGAGKPLAGSVRGEVSNDRLYRDPQLTESTLLKGR
jgi:hypothetical protein